MPGTFLHEDWVMKIFFCNYQGFQFLPSDAYDYSLIITGLFFHVYILLYRLWSLFQLV